MRSAVRIFLACLPLAAASAQQMAYPQAAQELLNKHCLACHSERLKTAGVVLEKRDLTKVSEDAEIWERVVRKLRAGEMPPSGMPRPERPAVDAFATWLETTLDRAAASNVNPGRTLIHRLNRTEYANSIRDLLALDTDVSQLLPPDDSADGFDNIAQKLTISPALLERYMSASAKITRLAVGDPAIGAAATIYRPAPDLSQDKHIEGLPLGTVGGLVARHYFPLDGEYSFEPKLSRSILAAIHGLEDRHSLEVTLDGERMKLAYFGGTTDDTRSHLGAAAVADEIDARFAFRTRVKAGPHTVGVAFLRTSLAETAEVWQQPQRTALDTNETKGAPHLDKITITGPFQATGPGDTPSRRRIFVCHPDPGKDELPCARRILSEMSRRAYRRPVTDADMEEILSFFERGRNRGTFEQGIETALRRVISGPEFVFRMEADPPNVAVNTPYRISDLELASRLSFFLWSTIPDDELYNIAIEGKLRTAGTLERQVQRMIADPKAQALVSSFADQWLYLRNLKGVVPDPDVFPDFDDNLRQALGRETELLFESIVKQDRNVTDLLTAEYTFVNERLARHYGIPGIYGDRFRRVMLTDDARRGLLGQGSILTLTSVAIRTSPVSRGKWILTNILGTPPPPPPPNVPALKEGVGRSLSMRDRMAEHRANAVCATCHKVMDPIGFALENFDAVGRWRVKDGDAKIDATDVVFDGTKVEGAVGLRNFLMSRKEVFVQTLTEKLLMYALGRTPEYYDMPAVRKILRDASLNGDRFSSIVLGIVTSAPFQMRMKTAQPVEAAGLGNPLRSRDRLGAVE
jgi:mono/diheme cytochrome c family protein